MNRRLILVLVVLAALPVTAFADHAWGNYHWARTSNPFTLKVHDNVSGKWDSHLTAAISDCNRSNVIQLSYQPTAISSVKRCTSTSGRIEVCNSTYGQTGWLGIAGISASGGHITKGYTKLNDTYFNTATYNTPDWRQLVTCQEIGHDFGLDHQDENFNNANLNTCMDYTNNPASNTKPNAHDYSMIEQIYAHLDSTTTISSVLDVMTDEASRPQTMAEIMADAGQWGMPVAFDKQGRPNKFVLPIGVNHAGEHEFEITHVLWAPIEPEEFKDRGSRGGETDPEH
jgi:hypothetical protein